MTGNEKLGGVNGTAGEGKTRSMRPSACRSHMRKTLAKEFEEIVNGLFRWQRRAVARM